jgi:hypothetical protein
LTDAQLTNIKNRELALAHFKAAMVEMMLASIDEVTIRKTFFEFAEFLGISPFQGMFQLDPAKQAAEYIKTRELRTTWEVGDIGEVYYPSGDYLGQMVIKGIFGNGEYFEGDIIGGNVTSPYRVSKDNLKKVKG